MKKTISVIYEIRVKGRLNHHWSEWLCNMMLAHTKNDETILRGELPDQAALHGVLNKLHGLGLTLISINRIEEGDRSGRDKMKRKGGAENG